MVHTGEPRPQREKLIETSFDPKGGRTVFRVNQQLAVAVSSVTRALPVRKKSDHLELIYATLR